MNSDGHGNTTIDHIISYTEVFVNTLIQKKPPPQSAGT